MLGQKKNMKFSQDMTFDMQPLYSRNDRADIELISNTEHDTAPIPAVYACIVSHTPSGQHICVCMRATVLYNIHVTSSVASMHITYSICSTAAIIATIRNVTTSSL